MMQDSTKDPTIDTDSNTGTGTDTSTDSSTDSSTDTSTSIDLESSADAHPSTAVRSDEQRLGYIQQLRWRSRRGLLELELLLLPFATDRLDSLDEVTLGEYERLLVCEDLDIYDWLQRRSAPEDDSLGKIVTAIRDYQQSLKRA